MEKGKLYRYTGEIMGLWKNPNPGLFVVSYHLNNVVHGDCILYLEQSLAFPNMHRVVFQDQSGWMEAFPEHFEELEEDHAESKT